MPWWYNPWAHLAFPSAVGLGAIALAVSLLEDLRPVELLTVPIVLLLVNLNEWHVHRNILHRRYWPLEVLFWRHTPEHHVIYVCDDMAMRSTQEFRLVLIPSYGIIAIFVTALPITIALAMLVSRNVACLWVATTMGYVVAYEWLHLSYHLPADSRIGRSAPHPGAPPPPRLAPHAGADAALELQRDACRWPTGSCARPTPGRARRPHRSARAPSGRATFARRSRSRSSTRRILPLTVFGSASTNSISRGYL